MGSDSLQALSGDSAVVGRSLKTNGTNGFTLYQPESYGAMVITNNAVTFPVVAVADTTFNTPAQFSLLTGVGVPWTSENLYGQTFNTDSLTVSVTGVYMINLWMNVNTFPNSSAKVAIRYRLNGTGAYSTRKPTIKSAIANDVSQLTGFGLLNLVAGDFVQLYVASDTTGNIVFGDANSTLHLVRQTA